MVKYKKNYLKNKLTHINEHFIYRLHTILHKMHCMQSFQLQFLFSFSIYGKFFF